MLLNETLSQWVRSAAQYGDETLAILNSGVNTIGRNINELSGNTFTNPGAAWNELGKGFQLLWGQKAHVLVASYLLCSCGLGFGVYALGRANRQVVPFLRGQPNEKASEKIMNRRRTLSYVFGAVILGLVALELSHRFPEIRLAGRCVNLSEDIKGAANFASLKENYANLGCIPITGKV